MWSHIFILMSGEFYSSMGVYNVWSLHRHLSTLAWSHNYTINLKSALKLMVVSYIALIDQNQSRCRSITRNIHKDSWLWWYISKIMSQSVLKASANKPSKQILWVVTQSPRISKFIIKLMSCWKTYLYKLCGDVDLSIQKQKNNNQSNATQDSKKWTKSSKNIWHALIRWYKSYIYVWYKPTVYKQYALFYIIAWYGEKNDKRCLIALNDTRVSTNVTPVLSQWWSVRGKYKMVKVSVETWVTHVLRVLRWYKKKKL